MSSYIVTIKVPKNPKHDPHNKVIGPCPIAFNKDCTDVTGEHHSFLFSSEEPIDEVRRYWAVEYRVTRVEQL
jgi:hypothetical protein